MEILFKTVHGSNLYGLAHKDSDDDFYAVVNKVKTKKKRYAKQSIIDGVDTTTVDLGTWLHLCEIGVPQAVEAMMSRNPIIDKIGGLRSQYRVGTSAWDRYLRTIKSFAMEDDFKHKRHALRLAINFNEMARTGRFNPTLSEKNAQFITQAATVGGAAFIYDMALDIAWHGMLD